jgi:tripartite-type tricarboxylate transporter receptor subunit TctC
MKRKTVLAATLAAAMAAASGGVHAQAARQPVRMMSGFPPGGNVDILARVFSEQLAESLGRPVIVETRPGAVGQIAAEAVKASPPDGSMILLTPDATMTVRPHTLRKATYSPFTDFVAIAHTGQTPTAIAVNAAVPAKNLREFAAWLKSNPNAASFSSPGAGGSMHFFGLMISNELGVPLNHVPYKGSGPAVADTAAGHVTSTVQPLGTMLTQAKAGKIRVLAVSGGQRLPSMPEAQTFTEQGFSQLSMENWFAIFGPAAMPAEMVNRYNAVIVKSQQTPAIRDRMRSLDLDIRELSPSEMAALVKRDYDRWGPVIKASGFVDD